MVKRRDRCDERMGEEAEEGGNGGGMPGGSMYRRRRVKGQKFYQKRRGLWFNFQKFIIGMNF